MSQSQPKLTLAKAGTTTVVRLVGPDITDPLYINQLGEDLEAVLEAADPPDLLVDLNDVERLSSAALGKLMRLYKQAQRLRGRIRLCSIRPRVREAFEITRFDQKFEIYPDADEALAQG